jgi:hypothetical protein
MPVKCYILNLKFKIYRYIYIKSFLTCITMVIVTTPKKRWFLETPLKMFSSSGLRELNSLNTYWKTWKVNVLSIPKMAYTYANNY